MYNINYQREEENFITEFQKKKRLNILYIYIVQREEIQVNHIKEKQNLKKK